MDTSLRDLWWVPLVRGISSIIFGIMVLVWPGASVGVVAILFASLLTVYGVSDIASGFQGIMRSPSYILRVLLGFLEIGIVVYLFRNAGSGITLALMGLLMAVALVVLGLVFLAAAFLSDVSGGYRWASGIMGVIALFSGISVAQTPAASVAGIIVALGLFGLIMGPIEIASAFILKNAPVEE